VESGGRGVFCVGFKASSTLFTRVSSGDGVLLLLFLVSWFLVYIFPAQLDWGFYFSSSNIDVNAGKIGMHNMIDYPMFNLFLMVYHKFGYFVLLVVFFRRLCTPPLRGGRWDRRVLVAVILFCYCFCFCAPSLCLFT
jgi:hypothetical protein